MMVAEDVIITEEVLVVLVVEEVQLQEEKETPRREGSGGDLSDRSAQEKVGGRSSAPREGGFEEEVQLQELKFFRQSTKTF
jgi:hypothetical protein